MEGTLEDGLITLDEENALNRYMDHFNLTQAQMNQNAGPNPGRQGRRHPGHRRGHRPRPAEHSGQNPLQPDEIREARLGHAGRRLPGGRYPQGKGGGVPKG